MLWQDFNEKARAEGGRVGSQIFADAFTDGKDELRPSSNLGKNHTITRNITILTHMPHLCTGLVLLDGSLKAFCLILAGGQRLQSGWPENQHRLLEPHP